MYVIQILINFLWSQMVLSFKKSHVKIFPFLKGLYVITVNTELAFCLFVLYIYIFVRKEKLIVFRTNKLKEISPV